MRSRYDVVAVGGGHDALVAAAYLAGSGRSVLVVGEQGRPGGLAAHVEIGPGFSFPVAPETLPPPDPDVIADLGLEDRGLAMIPMEPRVTVFSGSAADDRPPLSVPSDPDAARRAISRWSARDAARLGEFSATLAGFAGYLRDLLGRPPPSLDGSLPESLPFLLPSLRLGRRRFADLLRVLPMPAADWLDDWFETDALKAALSAGPLTGTRLGPRSPGTAGLLLHFHAFGDPRPLGFLTIPRDGASSLGRALRDAATSSGAHLDDRSGGVRRFLVANRRIAGVELADGREIACGTVVSDASPRRTFLEWCAPSAVLPPSFARDVGNIRYRGAAARVGLALSELPSFRDDAGEGVDGGGDVRDDPGHDPRFGGLVQIGGSLDALERSADPARYGEMAEEPLVLAHLPSVGSSAFAPRGRHVLAATVQAAPHALRGGWTAAARDRLLDRTVRRLESAFPGLGRRIVGHRVVAPPDLEAGFGLVEGSFHQGEPTMDQLYLMRPTPGWSGYRTPVSGLHLCGAGAYPYGGMHGIAGRNAARTVEEDAR